MLRAMVLVSALSLGVVVSAASASARPFDGQELECMALTIYWEARGESEAVQRAVAHVVINRTQNPEFPGTICGVVKQRERGGSQSCQFGWWCDGRSDRPRERAAWLKAQAIARDVVHGPGDDPSNGALYFHHVSERPEWRKDFRLVARIGALIFYAPMDGRPSDKSAIR